MKLSVYFDWSKELLNVDRWENLGRESLISSCDHFYQDKSGDCCNLLYSGYCEECGVNDTDADPVMNFGYPLCVTPSPEIVKEVLDKTGLTVLYDSHSDVYYLVLCGGGMDLSQNISLAYLLIEGWIPDELLIETCKQTKLSVYGENWDLLVNGMIESHENSLHQLKESLKFWKQQKKGSGD